MYTIYFAGDLFDHKHLTGNEQLATVIEAESHGRYRCILPQQWEGKSYSQMEIRNKDIRQVAEADFGLFNFDGTDLDSGTVVEYMVAKMLDIPAVLLRTDFRGGGFRGFQGGKLNEEYDWNLMVAGYPRTIISKHATLNLYNDFGLEKTHQLIAQSIVNGFDKLIQQKSLFSSYEEIYGAYAHLAKIGGAGLTSTLNDEVIHTIIKSKITKGLYTLS